jgi:hypothetical protein
MLLYNQKRHPLTWDAQGKIYEWEAFGVCDVPDDLVPHVKSQKVPVDVAPVAPEIKAAVIVDEQRAASRSDEVLQLKEALRLAEADAAAARQAVESAEARKRDAEAETADAAKAIREEKARAAQFEADLRACEQLLADTSRKLDVANSLNANLTAPIGEADHGKKGSKPERR